MKGLKLAMFGMVEGNGHPYSWSAIINGTFKAKEVRESGYPAIADYLEAEAPSNLGIDGAEVTHVWAEEPGRAAHIAEATAIANVLVDPAEAIGKVDAVIIPTDDGGDHVRRARPFVEAGLPVFVDKPLADNPDDLATFVGWVRDGARIMSTSALRYAVETAPYRLATAISEDRRKLGELRYLSNTTMKTWDRYGIHALEMIYPILGPGFRTVRANGEESRTIAHLVHTSGVDCVLAAVEDMYGAFCKAFIAGTVGSAFCEFADTYSAFKAQLVAFVEYLRTGVPSVPFSQTVELMRVLIAADYSRNNHGVLVDLETGENDPTFELSDSFELRNKENN